MGPPGFLQEGNREESSSDCKKQSVRMIVLKGRKVSSASGGRRCGGAGGGRGFTWAPPASLVSRPSTSPLTWSGVEAGPEEELLPESFRWWVLGQDLLGWWRSHLPLLYFSIFWVGCSFLPSFLGRFPEPSAVTLAELGEKFLVGIPAWGPMNRKWESWSKLGAPLKDQRGEPGELAS